MDKDLPTIGILGASGLIGEALASWLSRDGFPIVPIARRFTPAQNTEFGTAGVVLSIVECDANTLAQIFTERDVDIAINCVGVLQDGHRGRSDAVHHGLAQRLVAALTIKGKPSLLVQVSIPGDTKDDRTSFSRTKRQAEQVIAAGRVPFVILRPGFVIAPSAYGGSALIRALAALPFDLPAREARQSFATADVSDIARTIAIVARRWRDGERNWNAIWEVMARGPSTVGDVIDAFRRRLGGPTNRLPLSSWLMDVGATAGDLVARLGWSPPIRRTALREMRRGVSGNPEAWIAATGIEPTSLASTLQRLPAGVQEKWFARLYLAKPLVLASLVIFWILSGLIALTVAFDAATAILRSHGFAPAFSNTITVVSSIVDILIGVAIAFRKTCRIGLLLGIGVSLLYMIGAAVATPDMWLEPLGALVKTAPAIVLMLIALGTLEER